MYLKQNNSWSPNEGNFSNIPRGQLFFSFRNYTTNSPSTSPYSSRTGFPHTSVSVTFTLIFLILKHFPFLFSHALSFVTPFNKGWAMEDTCFVPRLVSIQMPTWAWMKVLQWHIPYNSNVKSPDPWVVHHDGKQWTATPWPVGYKSLTWSTRAGLTPPTGAEARRVQTTPQ